MECNAHRAPRRLSGGFTLWSACLCLALLWSDAFAAESRRISFAESEDGAHIRVELGWNSCIRRIVFAQDVPGGRSANWRLEAPWQWTSDREARSARCVKQFAFSATSTEHAGDRDYPFVVKTEAGTHIFLPFLWTEPEGSAHPAGATIDSPHCSSSGRSVLDGYHLIQWCLQAGRQLHVDPRVPDWLAELLEETLADTLVRGQALLGDLDESAIRLYVRYSAGDEQPSWRGWTSGPELFVNFSGNWTESDALRFEAEKYLTHEVLHLWNGWARRIDDGTPVWLNEGYAEFFALDLMRMRARITNTQMQAAVLSRSAKCLEQIENGGYVRDRDLRLYGEGIYDCGVMAIYQLDRRLESVTHQQAAAPWKAIFADVDGAAISLQEVLGHYVAYKAETAGGNGVDWQSGAFERFSISWQGLEDIGIERSADTRSDEFGIRARAHFLQSLVQQHCIEPPYGFSTFDSYVELDTGDRCGILSGNPLVSGVGGRSLFGGDVASVVESAIAACNADGPIGLDLRDGARLELRCRQKMRSPPPLTQLACSQGRPCEIARRRM